MTEEEEHPRKIRPPSLADALIPIGVLIVLLSLGIFVYGDAGTSGPIQVALILCTIVAGLIGLKNGHRWEDMGKAAVEGISTAMGAIFILLAVGALVGTWMMSGTIATLVHYGVQFLNPNWFYAACLIICGVLALSIGSAWTVAGTLGVGLIGIADALGVSPDITAGAVISGAYFGDKMSPLSETTNLAPAVAGTDLFTHVKAMIWTAVPSILVALILFTVIGLRTIPEVPLDLTEVLIIIEDVFNIGLLTLIPLVVVLIMSFRRIAAFPTIMAGALVGGLTAVILQPEVVIEFAHDPALSTPIAMLKGVWSAMATGFSIDTGYQGLDSLFTRGGMASMLNTVWLIISAMAFGGVLEYTGLLARLMQPVIHSAKSDKSIVAATGVTAISLNIVAGDQYMAIVLPGRMYRELYEQKGIAPETLSREIEDTGTITSPLVPWNSCGAYMAAALGVATIAYFPFCFFNLANVIISFAYALTGFQIRHLEPEDEIVPAPGQVALYGIGGRRVEPTTPDPAKP
ncbi:MAG: Na+/H+ antiporter NhaC [Candidatus Promineifilaceae bacterium]|nr:Na+/H+ antiporter NhaC [Candidatus Promineifilaceae bacterium]